MATKTLTRRLVVCLGLPVVAGLFVVAAASGPATADPFNAKGAAVGTADCGSAGMYTFVVNSGVGNKNGNANTWDPALAVSTDGTRAVFVPTELALTFVSPMGTFSSDVTKGNTVGTVECSVDGHAVNGPFSFFGTAIGNIVTRGQ